MHPPPILADGRLMRADVMAHRDTVAGIFPSTRSKVMALPILFSLACAACGSGGGTDATLIDQPAAVQVAPLSEDRPGDAGSAADLAAAGVGAAATSNGTEATASRQVRSTTLNTVDTIVNDMRLRNDLVLRGYEDKTTGWYVGPGHVMMGNDPRLSNSPSWWKSYNSGNVSSEYLKALLPWVVLFDGVGDAATNTRVQIRNFRAFYKSKSSGQWVSLGVSAGAEGYVYGKSSLFGATTPENRRVSSDGSAEIKPPEDRNYAWHGWWQKSRATINPTDIAAVFITLQSRLTVDDPSKPDDRAKARLLIQVGSDYYRDVNTNWGFIVPSIATSRSKLVTPEWQAFSATTFSDVGVQEPGGGITEAAFRAAPPPLE